MVITGASFSEVTAIVKTSVSVPPLPSFTVSVTSPEVVIPSPGVQLIAPVALTIAMPNGSSVKDQVKSSFSASVAAGSYVYGVSSVAAIGAVVVITGASLTPVTVKIASSLSESKPGSVAVKVIVSEPFQSDDGALIVATRLASILTVRSVSPV